jgi:hypothetical protein
MYRERFLLGWLGLVLNLVELYRHTPTILEDMIIKLNTWSACAPLKHSGIDLT